MFEAAAVLVTATIVTLMFSLGLGLKPLHGLLSRPAWVAMALMLASPSAPLILFRVRGSGGTAELAARLQIGAARSWRGAAAGPSEASPPCCCT